MTEMNQTVDMNKQEEGGGALRIGSRGDALALLDAMISRIERSNSGAVPRLRGKENAIGGDAYYWPRLEALKEAVERGIVRERRSC
jgi:hypothetical protein